MDKLIDGVFITPQTRIEHPKGNIMHAMKCSGVGYAGFGEAYFSSVLSGAVKGWKRHKRMLLNLVVPLGEVKFVIYDDRENSRTNGCFMEVNLSNNNYARLTVPPMVWMAFKGMGEELNLLLNIASVEHDPNEADHVELDGFLYSWR